MDPWISFIIGIVVGITFLIVLGLYFQKPSKKEIIVQKREDLENILERMQDILEKRKFVTLADFARLVGVQEEELGNKDNRYGWIDLSEARIQKIGKGYTLYLPNPHLLTK